ncbi:MAG TPA: ATP-dependent Clp protease ATP-binding subunit ClpA [Bdellovibrionota bacterium]|nr:ATP-dependent Clp protease ATP-binding subunit ClpA [Bdellovibrionota bacterium]
MIGRKAETVLNRAVRYAVEKDHEYFTLEHVFWSLLKEPEIIEILDACGADIDDLREDLDQYLSTEVPEVKPEETDLKEGESSGVENRQEQEQGDDDGTPEHPVATLAIQRLIQRALFQVQSAGKDEIQPADLLVAIFQARDSHSLRLLSEQKVERLDVINFISHGLRKDIDELAGDADELQGDSEEQGAIDQNRYLQESAPRDFARIGASGGRQESGQHGRNRQRGGAAEDPLSLYTVNLNERARAGKIDPLIGRKNELERMVQTLCRRRKSNPLLVGEAGVGKTALAEGLAARIVAREVPEILRTSVVFALDMGALLAGAKFRGDFEQRLKKVLVALEQLKLKEQEPILLIDEIHTVIGAGAVSGGSMDAANLLKPFLTQGDLRCIGSTTYTEYRNVFEKDHALARRFQKIDVPEPSIAETIQILNGLKSRFEAHHDVEYSPEAIQAAVELSAKHITERFLPDKAIDIIDEAGAKHRLARAALEKTVASTRVLDAAAIEEIVAQIARIPAKSVSVSQKSRLKNLDRDLKYSIYGQDHAIEALVTAIRLARSGLRTGDKPVGSFLFCGPTGVGKTELTKQLAHCLGVPFLRFDMSEYSEKHTISRLIGAPPGYVGFDQAGLLTDAVLKNPHSVVLLDEIEKAHSDIWNILLQVMDHGTLTDNNGRKADFRNAIIIMTSNVGSRDMERRSLGLGSAELLGHSGKAQAGQGTGAGAKKAVEQAFSPEFRNRLDGTVYFNTLDPLAVGQVVGKQLLELESQLLAKGVELDVTPDVRQWLAQNGYDRHMGARPMARLIQDHLKKPLAEEILFGVLQEGGRVSVVLEASESAESAASDGLASPEPGQIRGKIGFKFTARPERQSPGKDSTPAIESVSVSSEIDHVK